MILLILTSSNIIVKNLRHAYLTKTNRFFYNLSHFDVKVILSDIDVINFMRLLLFCGHCLFQNVRNSAGRADGRCQEAAV